jgi:hypothetical protein
MTHAVLARPTETHPTISQCVSFVEERGYDLVALAPDTTTALHMLADGEIDVVVVGCEPSYTPGRDRDPAPEPAPGAAPTRSTSWYHRDTPRCAHSGRRAPTARGPRAGALSPGGAA